MARTQDIKFKLADDIAQLRHLDPEYQEGLWEDFWKRNRVPPRGEKDYDFADYFEDDEHQTPEGGSSDEWSDTDVQISMGYEGGYEPDYEAYQRENAQKIMKEDEKIVDEFKMSWARSKVEEEAEAKKNVGSHVALKVAIREATETMLEEVSNSVIIKKDVVKEPVRVSSYFTATGVSYHHHYAKLFWRLELAKLPSMTLETFSSCPPGKIPCVVWTPNMMPSFGKKARMIGAHFAKMEVVLDRIVCFYHVTVPPFMDKKIYKAPGEGLWGANHGVFIGYIDNHLRGDSIAYWKCITS